MRFKKSTSTSTRSKGGNTIKSPAWGSGVLRPQVAALLQPLEQKYGVKFLDPQKMTDSQIVALGKVAKAAKDKAQQFPIIMSHLKQLLKAEIKLAQYYSKVTKAGLAAKTQVDQELAAAFVALSGYQQQSTVLANKVERAMELQTARAEAIDALCEGSFQNELKVIQSVRESRESVANHRLAKRLDAQKVTANTQKQDADRMHNVKYGHLES